MGEPSAIENYPYAAWWTDEERIKNVSIYRNTNNDTTWTYSNNPRSDTEFYYYDDNGLPTYKTFVLDEAHDLGIDAIPQLVDEESNSQGKIRVLAYKLWEEIYRNRKSLDQFDLISTTIYQRGVYTSRDSSANSTKGIIHRDTSPADIGRSLPFFPSDDDRAYSYIRTSLLHENWMYKISRGELAYYPLTVLCLLISHNTPIFLTPNRMEYNVLLAIKSYTSLYARNDGIYLSKKMIIDRVGKAFNWISIAHDIIGEDVRQGRENKKVIIMEDGTYTEYKNYLTRENSSIIYVLSRRAYNGTLDRELIIEMRNLGYEYRGLFVYKLRDLRQTRYVIYYFDTKIVNAIFPPILHNTIQKVINIDTFPPESPFEYSSKSTGKINKTPYNIDEGSISWTGDVRRKLGKKEEEKEIVLGREKGDNRPYFFQILIREESRLKTSNWSGDKSKIEIVKTIHNPLTHTTLHIYRGGLPAQTVRILTSDWYIYHTNNIYYCFSTTANFITRNVWDNIKKLQLDIKLIHVNPSSIHNLLSYSSIIRYWSKLRYSDEKGNYEKVRDGLTLQFASTQKETSETIATPNQWNVYSLYSLPVQTNNSPISLYPLPIIQPIHRLQMERNGDLVYFDKDENNVNVIVEIKDKEALIHDPWNIVSKKISVNNGIYEGKLIENDEGLLQWNFVPSSLIPSSLEDVVDYISGLMYDVNEDDMRNTPENKGISIISPCHLGNLNNSLNIYIKAPTTVNRSNATEREFCKLLGRCNPLLVSTRNTTTYPYNTSIDGLSMSTELPIVKEFEFYAFAYTTDQILNKSPNNWFARRVYQRILTAQDDRDDIVLVKYYQEKKEEELELYCDINNILLYSRIPIEYEELLEIMTPKQTLQAALETGEPANVIVVSRKEAHKQEQINYMLSTL